MCSQLSKRLRLKQGRFSNRSVALIYSKCNSHIKLSNPLSQDDLFRAYTDNGKTTIHMCVCVVPNTLNLRTTKYCLKEATSLTAHIRFNA